MKSEPAQSRSPLKDKPLRNPGQSVEEARRKLIEDRFELPAYVAACLFAIAALEWWRYFANLPPKPALMTTVAMGALAFAAWRLWRIRPEARALRQAIEGEKAVGQFLERLRDGGRQVFHDVIGEGFNVDHVVIGPEGVFTVETKTWSKPFNGDARISFDGETLLAGTQKPERDPVIQARAQSGWLGELLKASTGRSFEVRPVIVFPGWFIETKTPRRDIWVLNPKALPSFLDQEPVRLSDAEVKLAAFHLSRYIRAEEANRP